MPPRFGPSVSPSSASDPILLPRKKLLIATKLCALRVFDSNVNLLLFHVLFHIGVDPLCRSSEQELVEFFVLYFRWGISQEIEPLPRDTPDGPKDIASM